MLFIFHNNALCTLEAGLDAALTALIFAQEPTLLFYCSPLTGNSMDAQQIIRERFSTLRQSGLRQVFVTEQIIANDIPDVPTQVLETQEIRTLMTQHGKTLSF